MDLPTTNGRRDTQGFTLVELLVVVAIIALLLGMLLAGIPRIKESGNRTSCMSNLGQLGKVHMLYAADHEGELMRGNDSSNPKSWVGSGNSDASLHNFAAWPYVKNKKAYRCPTHPVRGYLRTYSMNEFVNGGGGGTWYSKVATRISQIPKPAGTISFMDDIDYRGYLNGTWVIRFGSGSWVDPVVVFHDNGSNFAFVDGHSEHWEWKDPRTIVMGKAAVYSYQFYQTHSGSVDHKRVLNAIMPGMPGGPNP